MLIALALADEQQVPLLGLSWATAAPAVPRIRNIVRMCRMNLIERLPERGRDVRVAVYLPLAGTSSASISSRMNSAASWAL